MKFPINSSALIDVTKPPYNVDNTGKVDCTKTLIKILDDILIHQVEELKATYDKLIEISYNKTEDAYIGIEGGRVENGNLTITFPENEPASKIIYFPKGTYLVSDTITYSLDNLKQFWYWVPNYENNRNIHFLGESREETVIRLADNSKGFCEGSEKPLISFSNNEIDVKRNQEFTNVAFMNTLEDITLDCGSGNEGVIGVRYSSSNCGRIENVDIKTNGGYCGIYYTNGTSQGVFKNINISGFDYGIDAECSVMIAFDTIDVSKCKKSGIYTYTSTMYCDNIINGDIPAVEFKETSCDNKESNNSKAITFDDKAVGRYYFTNPNILFKNSPSKNIVYFDEGEQKGRLGGIPTNVRSENAEDWACVDDFGAVGDGVTDCTRAIRKAMESGKSVIIFGEGEYLINGKIKIPKTVKTVDFMFCSLACGIRLVGGEYDAAFEVSEDSDELLFIENLSAWEKYRGHIRLVKHAAKRDIVISDVHLMSASLYFNSVEGSRVYLDNIFLTTGTYTPNAWLPGKGFDAVYSRILPYEFHGQKVYGRQINPERADIAMLNDNSEVYLDCYRIEGSGTALKCINGAKTVINLFNAGIGIKSAQNPLFDNGGESLAIKGAVPFGFDAASEYNIIMRQYEEDKMVDYKWDDYETTPDDYIKYIRKRDHALTFDYKK